MLKEENYPHLENIADLLWLSTFTGMQSLVKEEVEDKKSQESSPKPEIEDDEVEEDEPNIEPEQEEEQEDDLEVHTDNQEDNTSSSKQKSAKAIQSPKKLALDHYREWEKAFKFINLKTASKNRYELDEEKTVENIASTKVFDLVFKQVEEKSFFLTLVIDQGETMELWSELIKNFEQMLMTMGVFSRITIYYWDTKKEKPILYVDKALKREASEKLVVIDGQRNLVWVMSDCIAPAWKSGEAFKSIDRWATKSFTSILQMFPKEMWMGTMLFKGKHIRLSSNSFKPINKKLQIKSSKREKEVLKIPVISFDPYALQAWAKVVVNSKDNSISGIELDSLDFEALKTPLKKEITSEMRMQRFYSQASPTAQKLAFYMSVLPVDFQVTRILQEEKLSKSKQSHVAEVFLGGLIERKKKAKAIYYDFYPKVREELNANISADESFEIMADMSNFVSSHLGIGFDFKALLADPDGVFEGDFSLHDESLAYAKLASRVLKRKGGIYYEMAQGIDRQVNKKGLFDNIYRKNLIYYYIQVKINTNKKASYFIGSMIRGAMGYALKKITCINPSYMCEGCAITKDCLYYKVYEQKNTFSPYRLEVELGSGKFDFGLYLFQEGCDGLQHILSALRIALTQNGISKNNFKFNNVTMIVNNKTFLNNIAFENQKIFPKIFILDNFNSNIKIQLLTPLKIKKNNKFLKNDLEIDDILRSINQRKEEYLNKKQVFTLNYKPSYTSVIKKLEYRFLGRQANKQVKNMKIDGIIGEIIVFGIDEYSYELLKLGELIGVGKQTVLGLGQIKIEQIDESFKYKELENISYFDNNLKRHHKEAITAIIQKIRNKNKRILLSLVAGTGKSVILLEVINKLYNLNLYEGRKPRVLFLSDRKMLVHQSMNIMKVLGEVYEISGKNRVVDYSKNLFFATIQLMRKEEISLEKNFFDMIIIDNIPSNMENLEYILSNNLNAIQIGFSQKHSKKIKEYFGEVIYKYSYQDAINDDTVEPFRLERIEDDGSLSSNKYSLGRIALTILDTMLTDEKVVVVCASIFETKMITNVINKFNNLTDNDICFNLSTLSSAEERHEIQKKLHDDTQPFILVVTQDFGIGIDMQNVRKLVLVIKSISNDTLESIIHKFTNHSRVKKLVIVDFFNHINRENFDFTHEQIGFLKDKSFSIPINEKHTYWHLQLHPRNSSYSIVQIKEILSKNLIGLDFGEYDGYYEHSSLENWYGFSDDRKRYFLEIKEDDIILIRHGAKPVALVRAISNYKYVESPTAPIWFRHQVEVEVLSYYDEYIKKDSVKPFSMPQIRGTLWKSKNPNKDTYQIIDGWYKNIFKIKNIKIKKFKPSSFGDVNNITVVTGNNSTGMSNVIKSLNMINNENNSMLLIDCLDTHIHPSLSSSFFEELKFTEDILSVKVLKNSWIEGKSQEDILKREKKQREQIEKLRKGKRKR